MVAYAPGLEQRIYAEPERQRSPPPQQPEPPRWPPTSSGAAAIRGETVRGASSDRRLWRPRSTSPSFGTAASDWENLRLDQTPDPGCVSTSPQPFTLTSETPIAGLRRFNARLIRVLTPAWEIPSAIATSLSGMSR